MKLLLDQNLSPRLVNRLASVYLDMSHVALVGLDRASDAEVWEYARANDYIIETKDSDFNDISLLRGAPPQIIWLRLGDCTTDAVSCGGLVDERPPVYAHPRRFASFPG